jgi:hypothetical protein
LLYIYIDLSVLLPLDDLFQSASTEYFPSMTPPPLGGRDELDLSQRCLPLVFEVFAVIGVFIIPEWLQIDVHLFDGTVVMQAKRTISNDLGLGLLRIDMRGDAWQSSRCKFVRVGPVGQLRK